MCNILIFFFSRQAVKCPSLSIFIFLVATISGCFVKGYTCTPSSLLLCLLRNSTWCGTIFSAGVGFWGYPCIPVYDFDVKFGCYFMEVTLFVTDNGCLLFFRLSSNSSIYTCNRSQLLLQWQVSLRSDTVFCTTIVFSECIISSTTSYSHSIIHLAVISLYYSYKYSLPCIHCLLESCWHTSRAFNPILWICFL